MRRWLRWLKTWPRLRLAFVLLVWTISGCASVAGFEPPIYFPSPRPELKVLMLCQTDPEWCGWFGSVIESQVRNCTTLAIIAGVDPKECMIQ